MTWGPTLRSESSLQSESSRGPHSSLRLFARKNETSFSSSVSLEASPVPYHWKCRAINPSHHFGPHSLLRPFAPSLQSESLTRVFNPSLKADVSRGDARPFNESEAVQAGPHTRDTRRDTRMALQRGRCRAATRARRATPQSRGTGEAAPAARQSGAVDSAGAHPVEQTLGSSSPAEAACSCHRESRSQLSYGATAATAAPPRS
jgi:hypothetical protein